ncbi:MAG: hypothetical protein US20_C0005G0018 [Candidatus Pacebacteria bacterium GW2011_GWF1_36_5]|nr:MAG: hypothetical protein US20_C0005G0018 [Candidatus Pacebacteria bacterium GW2011_GWF1_36_5]
MFNWFRNLFVKKTYETRINGMSDILTTLDVFNQGMDWPIESQCQRLQKYDLLEKMLENKHESVILDDIKKIYPDDDEYKKVRIIKLDYYRATNEALADLEHGETPEFSCTDQDYLNELMRNTQFTDVIACFDSDLKTFGNAVLKIRRENNKPFIDNINPRYWFPVVELLNYKKVIAQVIAFDYEIDGKKYLKIEIHRPGSVETRVHLLKNDKIDYAIQEPVIEDTGLEFNTIITQKLTPNSDEIYSDSDFEKYNSIVTAMEVELSKIGYNLDKQGKILYGPENATQFNAQTGKWELKLDTYIPLDGDDRAPGLLTFDAQITQAIEYINKLQEQYYIASGTSAALFAMDSANISSGTALKRLLQRPLSKASKVVQRIKEPLELSLILASELENKTIKEISSKWRDGLVNDETEDTQNYNSRVITGTMSKLTAIQRLDNITEDQAKIELNQIQEEKKQESAINLDDLYGNEGGGNNE